METYKRNSEKKSKHDDHKKSTKIGEDESFLSHLTDVGLYSLGGLCAVSLYQLFQDVCQHEFRKKALEKILAHLGQPKQTNESMLAIMEGDVIDNGDAFVDAILQEKCVAESRQPLITDLIAMTISDGCYDARMRVLIKHVAWQLRVTWDQVEEIEADLAETLEYNTYVMSEEEAKEKAKKVRNRKIKRYALIGLATVGGGALIGLTGGLAAPLVAAGAGAVIGTAGAAALGSAAGVAIIGSLFGVAGAGLTGYKMKRRVGAIEEFAFEPLTVIGSKFDSARTVKQLHITIAVTGWLNDSLYDFRIPWSALAECREQYSLRWESKYLRQLGEAFDYILQTGISVATTEALKYTILSGLITAVAWPAALMSAAGAIDNPWHVCTQRATETGKQLAEVILAREQGNRPVTLIGFSMGSRVIFSCLEELSKRKGSEGLIEDVILLGAPVSGDPKYWKPLTRVVAGKIVNGYARGDWLLKFLYRTASVTFNVAGLGPVKWDNRRMHNIDLSDIIDGHFDYCKNLDIIMKAVGVRTKDELKPRTNKTSASSSVQSLKATHNYVDHECQTDDELESDINVDRKIKVKKSHTQYLHAKGEKDDLSENGSEDEKLKSETKLEAKDPSDSGISDKSSSVETVDNETGNYPPSNSKTIHESKDQTVDGKSVLESKEVQHRNDSSSQEKEKDDSSNEVTSEKVSETEQFLVPPADKNKKSVDKNKKSAEEMSERDSNGRKRTDLCDLNNEEVEAADRVKESDDANHLPLWESCYFTDSDPCSEGEADD